ncbi:putative palmitoyltransferase [Phytophthora cinnamomi]|uniref:putative palmitoyltransferase n=1 Tax=Phytophthora cinnamomi TaxID=4785 RepID=UPI003559C2F2|nr:putative palmitoyltransferase [Phytophthora cinnamomi]
MSGGFVAVALGLMLLKLYTWAVVLRAQCGAPLNGLYLLLTALMLWSYACAMRCRPASRRPASVESERVTRYCERCDADKAAHVHHCSVCGRCVFRMDHHCPWTGNCVGWSNKKFFLLFLLYTSLSCLVFNSMASPLVWDARFRRYEALLKCGWVLSLGVGLLLAGYFAFHLWLLREGKTTLEFLAGRTGELADCGFTHNVTVYFGRDVWSWWLPTTPMLDAAMGGRRERDDDGEEALQLVVE